MPSGAAASARGVSLWCAAAGSPSGSDHRELPTVKAPAPNTARIERRTTRSSWPAIWALTAPLTTIEVPRPVAS